MNTFLLIASLILDPQDFNTKTREKAVRLNLELDKGVIEAVIFGEHESGVVKLLYEKEDYIILEGSLAQLENKIVLVIKDYFFFPLSQRDTKTITKGYRK